MSTMEQALRDEIAWHGKMLQHHIEAGNVGLAFDHNARLAALTAALPAPGVEAPGDWVMVPRVATDAMWDAFNYYNGDQYTGHKTWLEAWAAMLDAAPSAPAEINQAQAQAMREALRIMLVGVEKSPGDYPGDWLDAHILLRQVDEALTPEPPR